MRERVPIIITAMICATVLAFRLVSYWETATICRTVSDCVSMVMGTDRKAVR